MRNHQQLSPDPLFLQAEHRAVDFSLFPENSPLSMSESIQGLINEKLLKQRHAEVLAMDIDRYVQECILPANHGKRPGAKTVIKHLNAEVISEFSDAAFYQAEIEIAFSTGQRRLGIIAQDRGVAGGSWMPKHHQLACNAVRKFASLSLPIVFFIDTPGADAGEEANSQNQAHSISRLIAESTHVDVPTLGIVLGVGYSGGAIPLAATNVLLIARDGVFNTIQPNGLQSIVSKFNLSWQECAKFVGVSPSELWSQHCVDGVLDYSPLDHKLSNSLSGPENLSRAIVSSIESIESAALKHYHDNPEFITHYNNSLARFTRSQEVPPTSSGVGVATHVSMLPSPVGLCIRHLRYLTLRSRIHSITAQEVGQVSNKTLPKGDLQQRLAEERKQRFNQWLASPDKLIYDDRLFKGWSDFLEKRNKLNRESSRLTRLIWGKPEDNYDNAVQTLLFDIGFTLYNRWKNSAQDNFRSLLEFLNSEGSEKSDAEFLSDSDITVLDVLRIPELRHLFIDNVNHLLVFNALYDTVVQKLGSIAKEAKDHQSLSRRTVGQLLNQSLSAAVDTSSREEPHSGYHPEGFERWLRYFLNKGDRGERLQKVEEWKSIGLPQLNNALFVILTYYFEKLLPEYYETSSEESFQGSIKPYRIGRRKDFWNRLTIGYRDLLVQGVLRNEKHSNPVTPQRIIERFFTHFEESLCNRTSANPVHFPGFQPTIEQALAENRRACGLITGYGEISFPEAGLRRVAIAVSNVAFQAGAFDMASAEKFCQLLVAAAQQQLPVVCFICSGGMQTKEGAAALFSMAVINDRITRFIRDTGLPMVIFGFGDCTGGAQASFVTHPLVKTYYFSGTNMPFAGQRVVPSYLPTTSTLANYLSRVEGAMQALVCHPFSSTIDPLLREIDSEIPLPSLTVEQVLHNTLLNLEQESVALPPLLEEDLYQRRTALVKPVQKVLIHARGCTAVKLIRVAQAHNIAVVLTASEPDMQSVPAKMLSKQDKLVCLGGATSDESYLNAYSILRVAEMEGVTHLHPGIGFLSESPQFASLCVRNGVSFIGPNAYSMLTMGNKSNAIRTAQAAGVPIVPGSHGVLGSAEQAQNIAEEIGYPVLLKAVYGGGGKGIQVVHNAEDLQRYYSLISTEAKAAFGKGDLYLEKFITAMRHIEVQILRDTHGNTKILGLRDCSVQRNNQKIIEESGSQLLPASHRQQAYDYAAALADAVEYYGAGTVEFIYDISGNALYFMEMNTRLQVEHPVTEASSGVDIVKAQFDIAAGESIAGLQHRERAYAMELRITAEKVVIEGEELSFAPDPGRITGCVLPNMKDIELISMAGDNIEIPPFYDSLIAQVIARGDNREKVIGKLLDFLEQIKIEGVSTNIALLQLILRDALFVRGDYDVNYLPSLLQRIDIKSLVSTTEMLANVTNGGLINLESIRVQGGNQLKVIASSIGIIYTAAAPDERPFINVGDIVNTTTPLLMSEAMKVFRQVCLRDFNTATAVLYAEDKRYRVEQVCCADGQQVTQGDLMIILSIVEQAESIAA